MLGGLKEKFIPTLNAFRLLVRVGPVFLGVVCVVYSLHASAYEWFYRSPSTLDRRPRPELERDGVNLVFLVAPAIFEPLRIALLAAAFDQAYRSVAAGHAAKKAEPARAAEAAGYGLSSTRRCRGVLPAAAG